MSDPQNSQPQSEEPAVNDAARLSMPGRRNSEDGSEFDSRDNQALAAQNGRGGMSSFLFMTVMLFMLTNNGGEDLVVRSQYRESLKSLRFQQSNFSAWLWSGGNAAANSSAGINFTLPETDETGINLARSAMGFGVPLHPSSSSYYTNITGFAHGPIEMHNLTANFLSAYSVNTSALGPKISVTPESTPTPWAELAFTFIKDINMTEALERIGTWNWSAPTEMAFRVIEKRPVLRAPSGGRAKGEGRDVIERMNESVWSDISLMHGRVELSDRKTGDEMGFDLEAVHFTDNGTIYGLAEPSGRHVDVRDIPSLVPAEYMNATSQAVNAELLARIQRLQDMIDSGNLEIEAQTSDEAPKTTCPFVIFAQLIPTPIPKELMQELESEMDNPTGIATVSRPELRVNAVMMSKECGIMLELRSAEGLKSQRFWRKVTTYSATAAIAYLALLLLFVRQTEVSQTPSGISRVSRWAFLTQAAADSISFVGHITFGILADGRPSLSLIAPAFLAAVLLAYEAQFSVLIHQIQQPEDSTPTQLPSTTPPAPTEQDAPSSTLPISSPLTGSPSESPAAPASQQGARPSPATTISTLSTPRGALIRVWRRLRDSPQARFWLSMFLALALFVNFWIPQIIRSARRGTTSGLRPGYLVGTTTCRAYFALYLFACPKNVLGIESSPWILVLVGFMFLQIIVVMLQDYLGPGFFLPRTYTPTIQYDYHPYIPLPDDEAPEPSLGDCAICMEAILVQSGALSRRRSLSEKSITNHRRSSSVKERENEKERERGVRGILDRIEVAAGRSTGVSVGLGGSGARRSYALAPCHHLFHTSCLERWLVIKNICPQCRRPLPPL